MRRHMLYALAFVPFSVGCNQSIPIERESFGFDQQTVDSPGESGTRLKRRVMTAADGSRQSLGWFDTQRQESCAFRLGPDGVQRCMPSELVSDRLGIRSSDLVVYTDATCTTAVYVAVTPRTGECNERLNYIFQSPDSQENCPGDYYYVYQIGEEVSVGDGDLYVKRESGCTFFNFKSRDYVYRATQVPADAFVSGELTIE